MEESFNQLSIIDRNAIDLDSLSKDTDLQQLQDFFSINPGRAQRNSRHQEKLVGRLAWLVDVESPYATCLAYNDVYRATDDKDFQIASWNRLRRKQ